MHGGAGWLDRDGILYPCAHGGHDHLAGQLGRTVADLEQAGWIRVLGPPGDLPGSPNWLLDRGPPAVGFHACRHPSEAQRAWLLAEGHVLPDDD
jgi:hypothetical protein